MTTATPSRTSKSPSEMSTIKPILRNSTSVLGVRRRSPSSGGEMPSSPTKKRKTVVFNESLNMVQDISGRDGTKTLDEAKREVRAALERHKRGDDEDYDTLKEMFAPPSPPEGAEDEAEVDSNSKNLGVYVVALTALAPMVERTCSGLVKSVLRCRWLERDDGFARAYIQLLAALSSVQGSLIAQVLGMMVGKFSAGMGKGEPPVPGFDKVDRETRKERLHLGLRYLLDLFPDSKQIILKLVESKFPYTEDSKAVHMEYIDSLLRLKQRPELERDIMELILSRLVKLDVEMTLDLENDDDDTTQAVMRELAMSESKDDDDESDAESVLSDDDEDEHSRRVSMIKSKLETMDAILDLLFSIYTPIFEDPDSPKALEAFQDLLSDFSNVILPHLKSRHTQYLLFRFAMKSPKLMEMFIGTLFNIAFESSRLPVVKQAAVAYLASFTARGAQVSSEQVQRISKTFLDYIDHLRASHSSCRGPDVRRYGQYYAYFQGLLYIFCFRWRDLIDRDLAPPTLDWDDPGALIGQDLPWLPWLKSRLQVNISSKLNPLKCCSPIIVDEFARLSHHLRLMYIYPQIEKNKALQLSQFFSGSYATGSALRDSGFEADTEKWTHVEACFPFDPFQLPLSKRWLDLENTYLPWKPFAILNREEKTEGEMTDGDGTDGELTEDDDDGSIREGTATDDE